MAKTTTYRNEGGGHVLPCGTNVAPNDTFESDDPDLCKKFPNKFVRVHADLAVPIVLAADTDYWIGMSGDGLELGAAFFFGSGEFLDGIVADYSDAVLAHKNDSGHALI